MSSAGLKLVLDALNQPHRPRVEEAKTIGVVRRYFKAMNRWPSSSLPEENAGACDFGSFFHGRVEVGRLQRF